MGDQHPNNAISRAEYEELSESVKELKQVLAEIIRNCATTSQQPQSLSSVIQPTTGDATTLTVDASLSRSQYTRMEFPNFSGKEDPLIWLHRCELYFRNARTPPLEKVELAAFNMTGEAQLWYYQILRDEPQLTWGIFKDYCRLRFGPPRSNNPLGELVNLKQRSRHVDEYISDFQLFLARTTSVRVDQHVDLFTAGLDELLRIDVERSQPSSLAEAINTSRDFYRRTQLLQHGYYKQPPSPLPPPTGSNLVTITNSRPHANPKTASGAPPIRRLSQAEQEDRKSKGLCFNCDEIWHRNHRCKHLFCVLGLNEDEEAFVHEEVEPNMEGLSLHAIIGDHTEKMMKIQVTIAGQPLLALIDSGSTHNFIDESTTRKLGLPMSLQPSRKVVVATGDHLPSSGSCEQVLVHHEDNSFHVTLLLIPLVGFDIVLGITWLSSLGPIWWDFNALTMRFSLNRKEVLWKGEPPGKFTSVHYVQPVSNQVVLDKEIISLSNTCSHKLQIWLLYTKLLRIPFGWLECMVTWFSSHLAMAKYKAMHGHFASLFRWLIQSDSNTQANHNENVKKHSMSYCKRSSLHFLFSNTLKKLPSPPATTKCSNSYTSLSLPLSPRDCCYFFHTALTKDWVYLFFLRLSKDVAILAELERYFQLVMFLFQNHSRSIKRQTGTRFLISSLRTSLMSRRGVMIRRGRITQGKSN